MTLSATMHSAESLRIIVLEMPPDTPLSQDIRESARTQAELTDSLYKSLAGSNVDGS